VKNPPLPFGGGRGGWEIKPLALGLGLNPYLVIIPAAGANWQDGEAVEISHSGSILLRIFLATFLTNG
jgi:hypothetical protein